MKNFQIFSLRLIWRCFPTAVLPAITMQSPFSVRDCEIMSDSRSACDYASPFLWPYIAQGIPAANLSSSTIMSKEIGGFRARIVRRVRFSDEFWQRRLRNQLRFATLGFALSIAAIFLAEQARREFKDKVIGTYYRSRTNVRGGLYIT